ncbi:hypothetical protein TrRE_jg1464, partial [Triparma retinervis]
VHGFKGSNLVSGGVTKFLTVPMLLNPFCSPDIRLPMTWSDGDGGSKVQDTDDLVPGNPLTILGKVYAPLLRRLALENGSQARMGAQVAWSAVNGEPGRAGGLLLAGGPFGGNWSFLRDMARGGGTLLYRQKPEVLFTYSSPFCFMPLEKETTESLEGGGEGEWDPKRAESWAEHGILLDPADPDFEEKSLHLQNCLDRALAFRATLSSLKHDKSAYPPIAILAGEGTKTSPKFRVKIDSSGKRGPDFAHDCTTEGDGRFLVSETRPCVDLDMRTYRTRKKHNALLTDTDLVMEALGELKTRGRGGDEGLGIDAIDVGLEQVGAASGAA